MDTVAVLMTVGTSLIKNIREASARQGSEWQQQSDLDIARDIGNAYQRVFPNFGNDLRNLYPSAIMRDRGFPSAEIQSFWFWIQRQQFPPNSVKHIVLFPTETEEALACADQIGKILKDSIFPALGIFSGVDIHIESFAVDTADEVRFGQGIAGFLRTLSKWFSELDKERIQHKVLNITGGYKVLAPVLTLLGFQRDDVEVIYQHEDSALVVTLPSLPMAWDFKVLDEYRTLVQRRALNTEPPPRFKAFFTKNGNQWTLNAFGDLLRTEYERDRLKRFGYGARLIRRWLPKDVQAQLEEKQIPRWENVWIGDQIPETVEHSRGHSQRLMEYAAELLEPQLVRKRDFLSADELYCLICCLWLHDIGHTGLTFRWPVRSAGESDSDVETFRRFLGVWGLKQSQLAGVPPDVEIPVALFPSLVRLFHNFISAQRICCGEYLPERERDAVALISMYDRREMPLRAGTWRQQDFGIVAPALGNLIPDDGIPFRSGALTRDRILFLCAVLRLLDGLDVQSDRVIDENYWRERRQRTREEVRYCGALLERLAGAVNGADAGPARGLQEARAGLDELVKQWEKLPDHLEGWDQADHVEESAKSIVTSKINPLIKEVLFPAGAVAQPQEPLVHAISLANRILFKMMQEAHFYKHSRVKLVYLTFQEAGYQVQMMFEEEVPPERKKSLAGDIWDEVQPIKQLLEQHGINVTGIFDGVSGERLMPQEEGRDPRG